MPKKQETTELVETQSHDLIVDDGVRYGFENVDVKTIRLPRAKLLQSNSPEVADRDYDFRAGDVIHALLMMKLPEKFVPIMFLPDSNILFTPREEAERATLKEKLGLTEEDLKQTILCRAVDGKNGTRYGRCDECKLCMFNGDTKPFGTSTINVLILPEGMEFPVVLQFANTSYKHGRKMKDLAFISGGSLFSNMYKIETILRNQGNTAWYELKVKPAGKTPTELLEKAKNMYNQFKSMVIHVDDEDRQDETVTDAF